MTEEKKSRRLGVGAAGRARTCENVRHLRFLPFYVPSSLGRVQEYHV